MIVVSSAQWVTVVVVLPATVFVWLRMRPLAALLSDEPPGRRMRRLIVRRGFLAMALWQWSVGLFLIASGAAGISAAVLTAGAGMLFLAWFPQAVGL